MWPEDDDEEISSPEVNASEEVKVVEEKSLAEGSYRRTVTRGRSTRRELESRGKGSFLIIFNLYFVNLEFCQSKIIILHKSN